MDQALTLSYKYPICAMVILLILMLHFFSKRQLPVMRNRFFSAAILIACTSAIFEFFAAMVLRYSTDVPLVLSYIVLILFYLLRLSFPAMMVFYVLSVSKNLKIRNLWGIFLLMVPTAVGTCIILFTPITNHFFTCENGVFRTGMFFSVLHVVTTLYAVACILYAAVRKVHFTTSAFRTVAGFSLLGVGSAVLEIAWPGNNVASMAIAAAMLIAYLSLPKPESVIDHLTGLLNLDAMMAYTDELIEREKRFYVLVMKVENVRRINSIFGYTIGSLTLRNVADYLSTFSPDLRERSRLRRHSADYEGKGNMPAADARLMEKTLPPAWAFRMMSNQFAVVSTSESTHEQILSFLHDRFEEPWHIRGLELNLMLTVAEMKETGSFASGSDLYKVVEIVLPAVPKGDTVTVSERELSRIERDVGLEKALEKAIAEEELLVRFQPVFSVNTGKYEKVEALVRFSHEEYGDVPPSEFIPIAEKRGLVAQIDEFVLKKACEFLKTAKKEGTEIEYVSVNLSLTVMASSAFPRKACAIVDEYGLEHRKIVFEIPEAALLTSILLILENLTQLASLGFSFALDNVGLGPGDLGRLAVLPLSIVKLDRSVLEEAESSPRSRILFENTIDVLRKMEIRSVVVGAETATQADWIAKCSPDDIQGFYYARPMDAKGCLAFIQKNNAQTPKKPGRDNFIVVTE